MYDIFLICPVRQATEKQKEQINKYIIETKLKGKKIYYPARDTNQSDPIGVKIISENCFAMQISKEVHIWYDPTSQGSAFDLGMAYMLDKPLHIVNAAEVTQTPHKSIGNFIKWWSKNNGIAQ